MKPEDHQDHLVDMLLSELLGKESPPDVREKVLEAAERLPRPSIVRIHPGVKPGRRSRRPVFALAAIVALLGIAGALVQLQRISNARTPEITEFSGEIDHKGGRISPGESIATGKGSTAVLRYLDGTVLRLAPDTGIVVEETSRWDRSKLIELVSGSVEAVVSPQPEGRPMVFRSGNTHAEVVGTRLSFSAEEGRVRLEVSKGAVRFTPGTAGGGFVVGAGHFAESDKSGLRHGKIPVPGITGFTLMNAETDKPIRKQVLVSGETISLYSLPTREINIRADYRGAPPASVKISVTRHDGTPTGLPPHAEKDQEHPPFFVAGDHWPEGRPEDCSAWTPRPGSYRIRAEAAYTDERRANPGEALEIDLRITE
ncbi:FecR domain-containing protein [Akkermansiaceae bacterium]|nr:FecR domain-containing protein [Akkermansiaceae bacterium]